MPTKTKRLRVAPLRTSLPLTAIQPPGFAGRTFATSPSKPEQSAKWEPKASKEEHGRLTAHPLRVITSLKSIVELHSNVPGSISSRSTPTWSPSLSRILRRHVRQHTLVEMAVFVAFIVASATLFSALAGTGYVPPPVPDQSVSGWRGSGLNVFPNGMISESSIFQEIPRWIGLGGEARALEDDEAESYPNEE